MFGQRAKTGQSAAAIAFACLSLVALDARADGVTQKGPRVAEDAPLTAEIFMRFQRVPPRATQMGMGLDVSRFDPFVSTELGPGLGTEGQLDLLTTVSLALTFRPFGPVAITAQLSPIFLASSPQIFREAEAALVNKRFRLDLSVSAGWKF
jgi:hypothetical protein